MPHQNRVNPFGELIATPARGTLMGNRGNLHNHGTEIKRPFQVKRWIICVLDFKDRRRAIMTPGEYTELFFLDEATALAAGHRPCFECQRERANDFRAQWAAANPALARSAKPVVDVLDAALHAERLTPERTKRTYRAPLAELPAGTFVLLPDDPAPYLVLEATLRPWAPDGYGAALPRPAAVTVDVLTPPSTVQALAAGYAPEIHASGGT